MKQELHDKLQKLLPASFFDLMKRKYRSFRQKNLRKISEQEFRDIVTNELNVKLGSTVFVHSSVNNLLIDFPVAKIIEILRDIIGEKGTLLFPTFHIDVRAEEHLRTDPVFNVKRSPTKMGLIPEFARRIKGAKRSLHPYYSVAAIGKNAEYLVGSHHQSIYPCGKRSPFYRMTEENGIVIGIGVAAYQSLTFLHTVEDIMKDDFPLETRTGEVFKARVIDYDKEEIVVETLVPHIRIGFRNLKTFLNKYIPKEMCATKNIKGMTFFTAQSKPLLERMIELAKENKTIYTEEAFKKQGDC